MLARTGNDLPGGFPFHTATSLGVHNVFIRSDIVFFAKKPGFSGIYTQMTQRIAGA
jgi:hypothetical protein